MRRIAAAQYSLPVPVSPACADLLSRVFVVDPSKRATVAALLAHPWCASEPPPSPAWDGGGGGGPPGGGQSAEALQRVLREAATPPPPPPGGLPGDGDGAGGWVDDATIPYTEEDQLNDLMREGAGD